MSDSFIDEQFLSRSLLIVEAIQRGQDLQAGAEVLAYRGNLDWGDLDALGIDDGAWLEVSQLGVEPREVFAHPDVLRAHPGSVLYYRGLALLPRKVVSRYAGSIDAFEKGTARNMTVEKAEKVARAINTVTSKVILGTEGWSIETGKRSVLATVGITLDGTARNKVGELAERLIQKMMVQWLLEQDVIVEPEVSAEALADLIPTWYQLPDGIEMIFGSEPDVRFVDGEEYRAVIEIKGGTDPAGALERYGAARKSFEHAKSITRRCRNFYLGAVFTPELERRLEADDHVEKWFNIIELLGEPDVREEFFREVFHHTLRLA